MNKTLVLLAGYPGTGKSYLAGMTMDRYPDVQLLSPDVIKEEYWDRYGFDTLEEKECLISLSWKKYYELMEEKFSQGVCLISDYPFSKKQKARIKALSTQYDYRVITIRLTGDIDILYDRQKKRDLDDSRHPGHILTQYHKSDEIIDHADADNLLSYEEFYRRCTERGYGDFSLGRTIEVDVSDYGKINYQRILDEIAK